MATVAYKHDRAFKDIGLKNTYYMLTLGLNLLINLMYNAAIANTDIEIQVYRNDSHLFLL